MNKVTIITHNGGFHADDVFAVATVILSLPQEVKYEIVRTRDENLISQGDYVVDVGQIHDPMRRRFDHHQTEGAGIRENGIPYASFGLVWKEYGMAISQNEDIWKTIEQKIVLPIDALDNGVSVSASVIDGVRPYTISDYLYSYWIDEHTDELGLDQIFHRAVSMAKDLLIREMTKVSNIIRDESKILDAYNQTLDKRIIVLESHLAWGRILVGKPEPLIVVYPSINGLQWNAKTVPKEFYSFERRISFPELWAGKTDHDLQEISKVGDAMFCHRNRFLATAKSKEGAIQLAKNLIS